MEIVENTCLLAHVVSFMVIYGWDYIRSGLLLRDDQKNFSKDVSICVKNKCL